MVTSSGNVVSQRLISTIPIYNININIIDNNNGNELRAYAIQFLLSPIISSKLFFRLLSQPCITNFLGFRFDPGFHQLNTKLKFFGEYNILLLIEW